MLHWDPEMSYLRTHLQKTTPFLKIKIPYLQNICPSVVKCNNVLNSIYTQDSKQQNIEKYQNLDSKEFGNSYEKVVQGQLVGPE